ncbi:hypothetical protein N9Y74_01140 [Alphaproteobacteria bacterium]|nr:hypothetical protein [Alphaproteobacteria bacterium]
MNQITQKKRIKAVNRSKIAHLRQKIAHFEPVAQTGPNIRIGFGEPDAYFANHVIDGGLALGGVHEIIAARPGDMGAALGFSHYLAARFMADKATLLYGQTHAGVRETGQPYAPALRSGDDLIYLDGVSLTDLMWAGEEALSCEAIGCIILASAEATPSFTFSRRLSMTARSVERPLIMALGACAAGTASAAASRWVVQARPNNGWQLTLARLRASYTQNPPSQGWQVFPEVEKKLTQLASCDVEAALLPQTAFR